MATPSGVIYLLKDVPLDNTYEHTIKFSSQEEQIAYFMSKVKKEYKYTTYIRKKDTLRVDYLLDDIEDVNYVMYRSSNGSRWYFSFVVSKTYKSEKCTDITVDLDVMQTYQFDYKLMPSFVERCHIDRWEAVTKSPIFSLTDEELEIGKEYLTEKAYNIKRNDNVIWFLVLMTNSKDFHEGLATPSSLNDIPTPYMTYLVPHFIGDNKKKFMLSGDGGESGSPISSMSDLMKFMGDSAIGKAIKEISYIPYLPFNIRCQVDPDDNKRIWCIIATPDMTFNIDRITPSESWIQQAIGVFTGGDTAYVELARINGLKSDYIDTNMLIRFEKLKGISTMTSSEWDTILANPNTTKFNPKIESKLLTHPYRYNILSNWKQDPLIIKNEYIPDDDIIINMSRALAFNNPARYWVSNYKGDKNGRSNSLLETSTVELPIISDAYYEYQLQNRAQLNAQLVSKGVGGVITGGVSGATIGGVPGALIGAAGGAVNGAVMIGEELAKTSDLKNIPDSIINSTDGSLSIADKNLYLTFYRYKIADNYLERIANYFHMYGYKVNNVLDLNEVVSSRARFNYVKTISCNITGDFDYEDLTRIKNNFNKGITFWHYYQDFKYLNYTFNNIEKNLI